MNSVTNKMLTKNVRRKKNIMFCSRSFEEFTGYTEPITGKEITQRVHQICSISYQKHDMIQRCWRVPGIIKFQACQTKSWKATKELK
jgi:PAS domain-containing protein